MIALEQAAWSIIDDIFTQINPCYIKINIESELPDCTSVEINACRGWTKGEL